MVVRYYGLQCDVGTVLGKPFVRFIFLVDFFRLVRIPSPVVAYLEKIISNAHKLSILTGNILNLSKLENQNNVPNRKPFDLSEQIRKTILMLESAWEEKNISFDLSLPDIQYSGDAGMLFHVWYNLIGNAIKFSEKNSAIRIDLRTAENKVYVTIEDHGCGIDEQTLPHIFEKFYQGDTSHSADGNGLGLALVKRIVILCGGERHFSGLIRRQTPHFYAFFLPGSFSETIFLR